MGSPMLDALRHLGHCTFRAVPVHSAALFLGAGRGVSQCALTEQEAKAPEHLCLSPTMHRYVVPTQVKLAASEGAVWPLPHVKNFVDNDRQDLVKLRKPPS